MGAGRAAGEGNGLSADARRRRSTNPFGPVASLVLRELFAVGERSRTTGPVPIAAIADRTGLDHTSITRIAAALTHRGLAQRRNYALTLLDPARVLDAWIASWDGERQATESFHVGLVWRDLVPRLSAAWDGLEWAWTGAAGAVLVAPAATPIGTPMQRVCYVAARDVGSACDRLTRLLPALPILDVKERGAMHVVVPIAERAQLQYGRRVASCGGAPVVSTAQLALDLIHGPGWPERPSVIEAARVALWRALVPDDGASASAPTGVP